LVPLCTTIALGSTMYLLVQHGIGSQQWRTWQLDWHAQQIFRTLISVSALASLASLGDSVSQRIVCDLYKKSLNNEDVRLLNKNFLAQNLQLLAP